jgi:hypothetical protein
MLHNWVLRNGIAIPALLLGTVARCDRAKFRRALMPTKEHGHIVETATEARQGEPGPSMLAVLTISTIALIFVFAIVWFLFFRT